MTVLHPTPKSKRHLLSAYRSQLAALIEMERLLVDEGVIRPDERRVMSREERRRDGVGVTVPGKVTAGGSQ